MTEPIISILIVDDEPEARDLLTMILDRIEGVLVIGTAESVNEAYQKTLSLKPGLILLDIQMPGKDGFELVRMINELQMDSGFVFVTAYDKYAIRAIRASAFDYLLKPVDPDELEMVIDRFREEYHRNNIHSRITELLTNLGKSKRIKVNTRTGFIIIDTDEILYCKAAGNYTEVYLVSGRKEIVTSNLGNFMDQVMEENFFRISRSVLINLSYLTQVDNKKGTCTIKCNTAIVLRIARSRRMQLNKLCGGAQAKNY
jgi:two-component system LytT family response regulator